MTKALKTIVATGGILWKHPRLLSTEVGMYREIL